MAWTPQLFRILCDDYEILLKIHPVYHFLLFLDRVCADIHDRVASNGPIPAAPTRASPAPQPASNGKLASSTDRRDLMQGPAQSVTSMNLKVAAQASSDMRNIVRRKLTGYVGFANLPNQWHQKCAKGI